MKIVLKVINKRIFVDDEFKIVNNNTDYTIKFVFDKEWSDLDNKTLRIEFENGNYIDTPFTGDTVTLPQISNQNSFRLGVYAGDLHSTSILAVSCENSILDGGGCEYIIKPTESIVITGTEGVDVTHYAAAQVVDENLVASNIRKGSSILGVEGVYEPDFPTLFPPVITGGINEISWSNSPSNGDFDVTLVTDLNGSPVSSPLTITEEMDGSILTIVASATSFKNSTTSIELRYISPSSNVVAVGSVTKKPLVISFAQANLYLKKVGASSNTRSSVLFSWDSQPGTEVYADQLEIATIGNTYVSLYAQNGTEDTVRDIIPINPSTSGSYNYYVEGTVIFNNLTTGESTTIPFSRGSQIGTRSIDTTNFHVGDIVSIQANLS